MIDLDAEYDTIHMMIVQRGYQDGRASFDDFVSRLRSEHAEEDTAIDEYVAELVAECNDLSDKINKGLHEPKPKETPDIPKQ